MSEWLLLGFAGGEEASWITGENDRPCARHAAPPQRNVPHGRSLPSTWGDAHIVPCSETQERRFLSEKHLVRFCHPAAIVKKKEENRLASTQKEHMGGTRTGSI